MTRTHLSLLGLATLAVLGLSAVPAAHAQSLTLYDGDVVTVSGAGTVNTNPTDPYVNGTTSYNDDGTVDSAVQTNGTAMFTLEDGGSLTETGQYGTGLVAAGSGVITVSGGTIEANGNGGIGLLVGGSGAVTVSGGTIEANGQDGTGLYAGDSGTITVTGGAITATGPSGIGLLSVGTIDLFSQGDTPFLIDGQPMNNTSLGQYTSGTDTISGTLLDGQTLDTTFENFGTLNLNTPLAATPEPSACVGLGIGLLGLGALGVKARRRAA